MRITFGYLTLVFVGALLHIGCALPPDPPVQQTLGPALEQSGVIEQPKPVSNGTPAKELTPEEKQAAEDAKYGASNQGHGSLRGGHLPP